MAQILNIDLLFENYNLQVGFMLNIYPDLIIYLFKINH